MYPPFAKVQPLALQLLNQSLSRLLHTLLWRHIDREPRLALVVLLVHETLLPLVEAEEDNLRNIQTGVVLRNDLILADIEDVLADDGLHIRKGDACQTCGRRKQRLDILEQQEGGRGVAQRRREERVVAAQERDAV